MRILFLTQVLPWPLDAGPKARAYYVLRHLAAQHRVTLVSFVRATDTPDALTHLRSFCAAVHAVSIQRVRARDVGFLLQSLLSSTPFLIQRDRVTAMFETIARIMAEAEAAGEPFDAVHADQSWMAQYALFARDRAAGARKPLAVLDQHNAVYMIMQRLAQDERNPAKRLFLGLEAHKLARWEVATSNQFDRVVWVTREDYDAVQAQAVQSGARTPVRNDGVIPICGDPEHVPAVTLAAAARRVTFLGGLHYPPNAQGILWFATHCFPLVLQAVPDAILTVIGKQPPDALHTLGIPAANLEVTGYVVDPLPWLGETAAFVVPLLAGGGMRVKIVDGWTWGLPIVSTTVGAEGIALQPDQSILIADTPAEFARHVVRLLQDRTHRNALAQAGRAWVMQQYNWRLAYRVWDKIYAPDGKSATDDPEIVSAEVVNSGRQDAA